MGVKQSGALKLSGYGNISQSISRHSMRDVRACATGAFQPQQGSIGIIFGEEHIEQAAAAHRDTIHCHRPTEETADVNVAHGIDGDSVCNVAEGASRVLRPDNISA